MFSLPLPSQGLVSRWAAVVMVALVLAVLASVYVFAQHREALSWRAQLAELRTQHAEQLREWDRLAAIGQARALALLEQRTLANQRVTADHENRLAAARDRERALSADAGRMRDQLAAALSAPCGAGGDPGARSSADAAAAAGRHLLGDLDRLAEESSRAADALADQVAGLQLYVRSVCLATEAPQGRPETGPGALREGADGGMGVRVSDRVP